MNVPKFEFAMFVSKNESKNSSPEVSFFKKIKKIKNEKDECMVTPKQPVCPTEIINISDDDDLPSTESYLMNEVNNHHKAIMDYAKFVKKMTSLTAAVKKNIIVDDVDYTKIIKRDLPHIHCAINPIFKKSLLKDIQEKVLKYHHRMAWT